MTHPQKAREAASWLRLKWFALTFTIQNFRHPLHREGIRCAWRATSAAPEWTKKGRDAKWGRWLYANRRYE